MKKNIILIHWVDVPQQWAIDLYYYTKYLLLSSDINVKTIVSNLEINNNEISKNNFIEIWNNYSKWFLSSFKFICKAFLTIKKINKEEKIDYIHFFSIHPLSVFLQFIVKYLFKIDTIYDIISWPIWKGPIYYISYITEKVWVYLSKKYIVDHKKLIDLLGFNPNKEYIEIWIWTEIINRNFNKNLIKKENWNIIFMYIWSLNKDRELELLINVFNNLENNFKLYIIWKWNDEENLKNKVKNKNIFFLGYKNHNLIYDYMNLADVLISYVPKKDYFEYQPPTKLLEWLSVWKLVIASNTFAQKEILNWYEELIFEDNYKSLLEKVLWASKNFNKYKKEDFLKIAKKYSWENLVNNKLIPFYLK